MNAVVRIGIAGAGLIELIEASRDCVLAGIADPSLDAKAFAKARTIAWYPDCPSLHDEAWRREPGGGPAFLNLVHDIDNLRFICSEIVEVQAIVSNKAGKFAVDDTAGLSSFANGAIGTFSASDTTPAAWSSELSSGQNTAYPRQNQPRYLFAGTKGSLADPAMPSWSYPSQDGWYAPLTCTEMKAASIDRLVEQLRHFLAVIARRKTPLVEDAMGTLAVVEAVPEAARTGAGVSPRKILE